MYRLSISLLLMVLLMLIISNTCSQDGSVKIKPKSACKNNCEVDSVNTNVVPKNTTPNTVESHETNSTINKSTENSSDGLGIDTIVGIIIFVIVTLVLVAGLLLVTINKENCRCLRKNDHLEEQIDLNPIQ